MSKQDNRRNIKVYADWEGIGGPIQIGILHSDRIRGSEIFSFEYSTEWLNSDHVQLLDPDLQLFSGIQYLNDEEKANFGLFLDSSPDRFGRLLMRRREAAIARKNNRSGKTLFETDYLLGVYDEHRIGGLRFREEPFEPFLNDDSTMSAPTWTSLRELEEISLKLEAEDIIDDPDYLNWLNILIAPGSSLGGARPKASVKHPDNHLWIAKFPSLSDSTDSGGWEMVVNELAIAAGLNVAEGKVRKFNSKYHTYLTKRFDRTTEGCRIHFASAMTMLGYYDGQGHDDSASYLEIVEFLTNNGANVTEDLHELWRRIVFSICVSNVDDHLRNHGFLLTKKGWLLSPAYDINPVETGTGLKLNISDTDNSLDIDLAISVCEYFRLSEEEAIHIVRDVKGAVKHWKRVAARYNIPKNEQELKKNAFSKVQ
jgi:serine/threonine-protein kinase HipA